VEQVPVIKNLKNNSSPGFDEIPTSLVKQYLYHFIKPLVHIYNVSLQTDIFPYMMKKAKLKPLFKKGVGQDIKNYKPISILSVFSKPLEKLVHNRLLLFLKRHNILTCEQHGFVESKSTETASHHLYRVSRKPWTDIYMQ